MVIVPKIRRGVVSLPPWHYFGGKLEFLPWLYSLTPRHAQSVEVFGGSCSWTLGKPSSGVDVINEVDGRITHFFEMLRDHTEELARAISLTPYSLDEFERCQFLAQDSNPDPIDRARAAYVLFRQGSSHCPGQTWSRVIQHSRRGMSSSVSRWLSGQAELIPIADRLRTVQIDRLDFRECLRRYDKPGTCFYCDPTYLPDVRSSPKAYLFEMNHMDHRAFLLAVNQVKASVVVSHYAHPEYDGELTKARGWDRHEQNVHCRSAVRRNGEVALNDRRVEVVWVKKEAA